jgi:uncharacterized protein
VPVPDGQNSAIARGRHVRILWIALGTVFLALAAIGIILPVMPTTPFLLLTAACYARGSTRFYHWLLHNRVFGRYLRDYHEGRGVPLRTKAVSLVLLWATIILSIYRIDHLHVRLLLPVIGTAVSAHVLTRPSPQDA